MWHFDTVPKYQSLYDASEGSVGQILAYASREKDVPYELFSWGDAAAVEYDITAFTLHCLRFRSPDKLADIEVFDFDLHAIRKSVADFKLHFGQQAKNFPFSQSLYAKFSSLTKYIVEENFVACKKWLEYSIITDQLISSQSFHDLASLPVITISTGREVVPNKAILIFHKKIHDEVVVDYLLKGDHVSNRYVLGPAVTYQGVLRDTQSNVVVKALYANYHTINILPYVLPIVRGISTFLLSNQLSCYFPLKCVVTAFGLTDKSTSLLDSILAHMRTVPRGNPSALPVNLIARLSSLGLWNSIDISEFSTYAQYANAVIALQSRRKYMSPPVLTAIDAIKTWVAPTQNKRLLNSISENVITTRRIVEQLAGISLTASSDISHPASSSELSSRSSVVSSAISSSIPETISPSQRYMTSSPKRNYADLPPSSINASDASYCSGTIRHI